jgi:anhydro-N-acetylmuramic acid kinase
MTQNKVYTAIGLMSGTSLDGVDAALIETDGRGFTRLLEFVTVPYDDAIRAQAKACFGQRDRNTPAVKDAEKALTLKHADVVKQLLAKARRKAEDIDLIGFHGQTIFHAPKEGITIQIGDGALLAKETGITVIADMRSADVKAGGEGAPLAPVYHQARVKTEKLELPAVILNIGGVGNVTWIGQGEEAILAFDTGPGNALMDDWAQTRTGKRYDEDGKLAKAGKPITQFLQTWMDHAYFKRTPPKSLDRNQWDIADLGELPQGMKEVSTEDGAATLLAFTGDTIIASQEFMPVQPKAWYVCGGGRHNKALMEYLQQRLHGKVESVDALGWNGDATEAECFAFLGVRSLLGLPLSFPTTTGVPQPQTGGVKFTP